MKIGQKFVLQQFKNKIIYKERYDNKFFSPLSFVAAFGSGIRDGSKSGSEINIPDPQHCCNGSQGGEGDVTGVEEDISSLKVEGVHLLTLS